MVSHLATLESEMQSVPLHSLKLSGKQGWGGIPHMTNLSLVSPMQAIDRLKIATVDFDITQDDR